MCFHQLNEPASLSDAGGHRAQCAHFHFLGHLSLTFLFSDKKMEFQIFMGHAGWCDWVSVTAPSCRWLADHIHMGRGGDSRFSWQEET